MRRRRSPTAPRNARLVYTDGTTIPLELFYAGTDDRGFHLWIATARADLNHECELYVDEVPPHTSIEIVGLQR